MARHPQERVESRSKEPILSASEPAVPGDLWCAKGGRGWRWEEESPDDWLLLDRSGRLAVHLTRQTAGWRVVHPRCTPEVIEPDLDAAKTRAQTLALATLPLPSTARRANATTNKLPSGARTLALQDAPPEQRPAMPAEVIDTAQFSVPLNILGGHRHANAPALDPETRRAIVRAEIEPPRIITSTEPPPLAPPKPAPAAPDSPDPDARIPDFLRRTR
jgi:hypothetical protein